MKLTYHLNKNAPHHYNPKDIGTDMCQLIVPSKSQFESNTESLFVSFLPTNLILQLVTALTGSRHTLIAITLTLPTKEQTLR